MLAKNMILKEKKLEIGNDVCMGQNVLISNKYSYLGFFNNSSCNDKFGIFKFLLFLVNLFLFSSLIFS